MQQKDIVCRKVTFKFLTSLYYCFSLIAAATGFKTRSNSEKKDGPVKTLHMENTC